jgi:hypothetical protein
MGKPGWMSLLVFCCTTALGSAGPAAATGEIKEPSSRVGFPLDRTWGSHQMRCIGTALRKKLGFKVYAACLYVDRKLGKEKLLKLLSSGRVGDAYQNGKLDVEKLVGQQSFYHWLITSDLPISVDMSFIRDVPLDKIKETYREGISRTLKDEPLMQRFLSLLDRDLKRFQHVILNLMPSGRVILQYGDKTNPPIASRPLAQALLGIYFGGRPISDEIKRSLVQHVDWLLE